MINYTIRRLISAIPTILIVAVVIFFLIRCVPGNPAVVMAGETATAEEIAQLETKMGLDQPVPVQFVKWLGNALQGDLGESVYYKRPVLDIILERLEPTLLLMGYAIVIALAVGLSLGITAAINRNGIMDRLCMILSIVGISMPGFWLGLNLVILLAVQHNIFPAVGYVTLSEGGLLKTLYYLTLPALALGLQRSASLARITRSSMLEVLGDDYIRTARSKGLKERIVIWKHALKNAANPILTQLGISIAHLMGGSVVMESVFNIPGVGQLAYHSISRRDYPTIQGHILFIAVVYVFVNLAVDLMYRIFDPRVELK